MYLKLIIFQFLFLYYFQQKLNLVYLNINISYYTSCRWIWNFLIYKGICCLNHQEHVPANPLIDVVDNPEITTLSLSFKDGAVEINAETVSPFFQINTSVIKCVNCCINRCNYLYLQYSLQ